MDWIPIAEEKQARYARGLVVQGNVAYAAGLALLMAGDDGANRWLRRAAARWRESWDVSGTDDAWGRPIGALKASLLAYDEPAVGELACWALELGSATAASPIGRYAGALALLSLGRWTEAAHVAAGLQGRDDFPHDVAAGLAAVAAGDGAGCAAAIDLVVESFESREAYLEDIAVADTALVLAVLARRRGIELSLRRSAVLPD